MQSDRICLLLLLISLAACDTARKSFEYTFNRYRIGSPSMEPALHVGDSHPVFTTSTFKVNDIVAYYPPAEFSAEGKTLWVHRLIGSPGDILEMESGNIKLNGHAYPYSVNLKHEYVVIASMPINKKWLEIFEHAYVNVDTYKFFATDDELKSISKNSAVTSIKSMIYSDSILNENELFLVPGNNRDNWGPLTIPKKGDTVTLTEKNLKLYARILGKKEHDIAVGQSYSIPVDCYFVLGDSRHNSLDSRYLGFIPETDMKGVMTVE
jgi:signal peptidase I